MFVCINCKKEINENENIGTRNRNHCPHCLFSQHLDSNIPGDRESTCKGQMEPIALTFKKGKTDKYGNFKQGELKIVHKCKKCKYISLNRIAGDDDPVEILKIFNKSSNLTVEGLSTLKENDLVELKTQLFGKEQRD